MSTFELHTTVPFRSLSRSEIQRTFRNTEKIVRIPQRFHFSVAIVSDRAIRKFNKEYRGKDKPTDVLSFRYTDDAGEIILSAQRIRAQAKEYGHTIQAEAVFLLVHGILHIMGWDHERSEKEARAMRQLEQRIIRLCGLAFAR